MESTRTFSKTCGMLMVGIVGLGALALSGGCASTPRTGTFPPFEVRVEIEETAFPYPAYKVTNNGSGMFWGSGSAHLVRIGGKLFASAFEHVPGCAPLNNARWVLYERASDGWRLCQRDEKDRTREPSPLAVSHDGQLIMSVNPTLVPWVDAPPDVSGTKMAKRGGDVSHKWRGGPARPEFLRFNPDRPTQPPVHLLPEWEGEPKFTEHSYRTFAADGENGEFILFQNIGVGVSEWALLTKDRKWKTGRFFFVKRTVDPAYTPYHGKYARVNYPNVMLRNREVHFIGLSAYNIWNRIDPKKTETWGRANWGGRFRRIHYAWTPDVTTTPFTKWTTIDDTMDDGGTLNLGDSWLAPDGRVHVVWMKNPIHPRLRDKHFPDIKRDRQLCYGILKKGQLLEKRVLASGGDTTGSLWPEGKPRFHITPKHELYILYSVRGVSKETRNLTGSYAIRIADDGTASTPVRISLEQPFTGTFFTTTPRGGNRLSETAELLIGGKADGQPVMRYARLRFQPPSAPVVTIRGNGFCLPGQGRVVKLHAEVNDLQNDVKSVLWKCPDGTLQAGSTLAWHVPEAVGEHFVLEVEATDRKGNVGRARRTISLPPPELANSAGLVIVEAEKFVGQGGGEARICNTVNVADTSISYWHKDIGHWLEWDLPVPTTGRYELWMRYTTPLKPRRSLLIDGTSPAAEFANITIPPTGGWSGTEDNWRYLRLGPPLKLAAGTRRLRMTNLADGLGVDCFVLRPLPSETAK